MSLLDQTNLNGGYFLKALYYANLIDFNSDEKSESSIDEADYEQAMQILETLRENEPQNSAISYYLALIKYLARHEKSDILRDLNMAAKGKYFNKYWTSAVFNVWSHTLTLPESYSLVAATIQSRLNYPQAHWKKMKSFIKNLNQRAQVGLAKSMMAEGIKNFDKAADVHWDPLDYHLGYRTFQMALNLNNDQPPPFPYNSEFRNFDWYKTVDESSYNNAWNDILDPKSI